MAKLKSVLTSWWFVSLTVLLLLVLLFCLGLPLFVAFLRPWWVRLLVFAVLVGGWALLVWLRARKARKAAAALSGAIGDAASANPEEQVQARRMSEAMATLRQSTAGKRDYLYSRPWYVIIGPPGSGKTTALVNSGLRFPFSDQSFKGIGGTRNLDFWFADEAVLIDTAGRYTSQDSDATSDSKAWRSFLDLLKRNRPLQPVNGIIVAIGTDELLRGDRQAIDVHAAAIRRRLAEIRAGLEIQVPVYLLVTKADLLAGFVEFFDDLDVEGRRAVLGQTFNYADGRPRADAIATAFDGIAQAVSDRQAKRLAKEPDALRRSLILGFPAQMTALRSRLIRLIDGAFVSAEEPSGTLRGLYFTSGVQEGAPLDRLLSGMAEIYDQPQATGTSGSGRAYFLNRLLSEVMFPEAGLVQMDPGARRRLKSRLVAAIGAIALVSVLLLAAWGVSFFRNRALHDTLLTQAKAVDTSVREHGIDLVQVSDQDADLEQALSVLDQERALARGYGDQQQGGAPLSMRFGLFQSGHAEKAVQAYREGLRRIMLPRLLLRLEAVIKENVANPLAVYEPLKVYLMLGGQKPGGLDAGAVKGWVNADWANAAYPGADRADLRKRLGLHLDALLEDKDMASVWANRQAPIDGSLVAAARAAVQTMSVADRAYAILRQKAMASAGAPWLASRVLSSGDAQAFANGAAVLELQVPYFFTRAGFEKNYQPGLLTVQKDLEDDLWVLGGDADTTMVREQIGGVRPGVAALYAKEYIAAWENVVNAMQPAQFFQNLGAFGAFTKTPSPWKLMLLELRANTTFGGGTGAARGMIATAIKSRLGSAAQLTPTGGGGIDAGEQIASAFRQLQDYVGDGKAPAPIDDFIAAVKTAGQSVLAAQSPGAAMSGGGTVQAQLAMATAQIAAAGAGAPPILQTFVTATAKGGSEAQSSAIQGAVTQTYASTVLPGCKEVTQDRYPFFSAATEDASVADILRFFGNGGTMDGFVRERLTPLLDTGGPVWRWRMDDPIAAAFDPASAGEFAQTPVIRDMLTAGLPFKVSLETLGPGVDAVEFSSGGTGNRFDRSGASTPRPFLWSPQAGTPEAHVTLFKGPQQVDQIAEQGSWALFRIMDKARKQNSGETAFLATFGSGANSATLRITLSSDKNPFSRGGAWSFRCPVAL